MMNRIVQADLDVWAPATVAGGPAEYPAHQPGLTHGEYWTARDASVATSVALILWIKSRGSSLVGTGGGGRLERARECNVTTFGVCPSIMDNHALG